MPKHSSAPVPGLTEADWVKLQKAIKDGRFDDYDRMMDELLDIQATEVHPEDDEAWELAQRQK